MFTDFFVRRPIFASVCSLVLVLIGIVSFTRLPVREFPDIDPPVVTVTTVYPGASPQVVETEVTEILEGEINGVDGIETLTSISRQGQSTITAQFELTRDLDVAAQDVRARISRVSPNLPDDIESPSVAKGGGNTAAIVFFALYGENFTPLELSDYADRVLVDALESVPGVSGIFIGGERRYAMRIWLDPRRMAARNVAVLDVEQALRSRNVQIPSGFIEGQVNEFSVRTLGRLGTPEEYNDLVVRRTSEGEQITINDVGYAEIGAESDRSFVRFNGQNAIALGIIPIADANTLAVAEAAKERMAELAQDFPPGLQYTTAVDNSEFVRQAINGVWQALFFAIALVIAVIFIFLRDWRATIIPAVTIPIALVGTFGVMFFLDFSVNTLTLFSLTLATGLVVDDTIVVLENIVRKMEQENLSPLQAAYSGVGEVVFAVIATTVVLVAVFLPVGFSTGLTGRLFTEFALTLAGAVVLSSFVALTLAPTLSARLLKRNKKMGGWFFGTIERILEFLRRNYVRSLEAAMKAKGLVVIIFAILVGLTAWLFTILPQGFLPTADRAQIFTIIQAPEGVSIEYTSRVLEQVEEIYAEVPEVQSYFSVGAFSQSGTGEVNRGVVFARLKPWSERDEASESQQAVVQKLFGRFASITGARVLPTNPPSLPGAGFSQPVQFVLQLSDLEQLAQAATSLENQAQQLDAIVNVNSNFELNRPELIVEVDRRQAANLGVEVADIARTLQIFLGGQDITSFNRGNRRFEVVVQGEDGFRRDPNDVREIYVRGTDDVLVPIANVASVISSTTPPQINHFNRFRSATIEGSPAPGASLGEALTALENLADEILPENVDTALAGQSLDFRQAGQSILLIFALAVVFIFLALAAQFESYIDPVVILISVPLALLGAFGALLLRPGVDLNIYGQIGLIMLVGLVAKNAILVVEFANQLQEEGKAPNRAAIAAGDIRFRPILMTAFSTIFGLLPLAFASGAGAISRVSLGTTVVGGMIVSTFLSLYVVPVFYAIAARFQNKISQNKS